MPVNLELKAKYPNIKRAERIAHEITESDAEILDQTDTYFRIPHGRLKLREIHDVTSELIWYDRKEDGGDRISHYERVTVDDSEGFTTILTRSLDVDVRVTKQRTVYRWNNCRVHIDLVEQLGPFVEFEVMESPQNDERERLQFLIEKFGITDLDIINCSYSDLLRNIQ
jgi:predicted adenylyl cyclase CyaB